jgi:hypothetical protein
MLLSYSRSKMSWDIPNMPDASMVGFRSRIGPTLTERVSICFSPFNHTGLKLKLIYFNEMKIE